MSIFDNLFNIDISINPANTLEKNKEKEKLQKLEKCKYSLREARNSLADFKTSIRNNWKGKDGEELIDKITALERQFTTVINQIDSLKRKIEEAIDEGN